MLCHCIETNSSLERTGDRIRTIPNRIAFCKCERKREIARKSLVSYGKLKPIILLWVIKNMRSAHGNGTGFRDAIRRTSNNLKNKWCIIIGAHCVCCNVEDNMDMTFFFCLALFCSACIVYGWNYNDLAMSDGYSHRVIRSHEQFTNALLGHGKVAMCDARRQTKQNSFFSLALRFSRWSESFSRERPCWGTAS